MDAHPLAALFPKMTDAEFDAFKGDIQEHGQRDPIMMYEGQILDGVHRARACEELGITVNSTDFVGDDAAAAHFVVSKNFHRRHLKTSQRALVAAELCRLRGRGNVANSGYLTTAQAAKLMRVSEHIVDDAKRLLRDTHLETLEAVQAGRMSVNKALETITVPAPVPAILKIVDTFNKRLDKALYVSREVDVYAKDVMPMLRQLHARLSLFVPEGDVVGITPTEDVPPRFAVWDLPGVDSLFVRRDNADHFVAYLEDVTVENWDEIWDQIQTITGDITGPKITSKEHINRAKEFYEKMNEERRPIHEQDVMAFEEWEKQKQKEEG